MALTAVAFCPVWNLPGFPGMTSFIHARSVWSLLLFWPMTKAGVDLGRRLLAEGEQFKAVADGFQMRT